MKAGLVWTDRPTTWLVDTKNDKGKGGQCFFFLEDRRVGEQFCLLLTNKENVVA